jgi:hypothetical protein
VHITPFALAGTGLRLFVHQTIDVGEEGHCQTADYQYRLASGDEKADWLLRWEYFRTPPTPDYPYTRAHLHVKATLATGDRELPKLHVPTARVPLELVLWHAIAEWGVAPKAENWREILEASLSGFEQRRQAS